jgi:hypothetical protein
VLAEVAWLVGLERVCETEQSLGASAVPDERVER